MVVDAVVVGRVGGLDGVVVDWVVVGDEGFALMSDVEDRVGCGDGCGDQGSVFEAGGCPSGVGDQDGVVLDASEEGDPSLTEGNLEVPVTVEVVGEYRRWRPAEGVTQVVDVFGWVSGAADGGIEDGALIVEPSACQVRIVLDVVEGVGAW